MIDLVPANVKFFTAAEADFLGLDKSRQKLRTAEKLFRVEETKNALQKIAKLR